MRKIMLALGISLMLAACAPKYYCETEFGQNPALKNAAGATYWPSNCTPKGFPYDTIYGK